MNLIYEGNKFQFDIPKGVTINYIKDLALKIFHYEEKGLILKFKEENLNNLNDKMLVNDLVNENEKNITIHLLKSDSNNKNNNNLTLNEINPNNKEKSFKILKHKFIKFHLTNSNKKKESNNFEKNLSDVTLKLIKLIKNFQNIILKVNNILNGFYNKDNYEKLVKLFEEKNKDKSEEINLKKTNEDLELFISDSKYINTQNNFQIKVINFIEGKIEKIKNFQKEINKIPNENITDFSEIIKIFDNLFKDCDFKIKSENNNLSNNFEKYYDDGKSNYSFDLYEKKKKLGLPKIRNETLKNFTIKTERLSKSIKLNKENESSEKEKKVFKINLKKNNDLNPTIKQLLPDIETKLIDSPLINPNEGKIKKNINKQISISNESKSSSSKIGLNINKKLEKENNTNNNIINEVKPKIMEKENVKISRNERLNSNDINNTLLSLKKTTNIPKLFIPIIKDNLDNKNQSKTDRNNNNKKEELNLSSYSIPKIGKITNNKALLSYNHIKNINQNKNSEKEKTIQFKLERKENKNIRSNFDKNVDLTYKSKSNKIIPKISLKQNINKEKKNESSSNSSAVEEEEMKEINQDKDKITEKNKNEEKISLKKSSKSLANLHLNDLDDFFIPIKKLNKEKEKEQIERLTKNLLPKNKGKLTSKSNNIEDISFKNENNNYDNDEIYSEKLDEKKRRKKLINRFDFII